MLKVDATPEPYKESRLRHEFTLKPYEPESSSLKVPLTVVQIEHSCHVAPVCMVRLPCCGGVVRVKRVHPTLILALERCIISEYARHSKMV